LKYINDRVLARRLKMASKSGVPLTTACLLLRDDINSMSLEARALITTCINADAGLRAFMEETLKPKSPEKEAS